MEDVKRDHCVHKVDGHMHKNKCSYSVLARNFMKGYVPCHSTCFL